MVTLEDIYPLHFGWVLTAGFYRQRYGAAACKFTERSPGTSIMYVACSKSRLGVLQVVLDILGVVRITAR